ncbi:MAG: CBS domain-containing protein, partial [Armatimonadota bacterium]
PQTSIDEVLRTLSARQVQRVAVVDDDGRLVGLVTDRDIVAALDHRPPGLVGSIIDHLALPGYRRARAPEITLDTTAGEIMETDLITVGEDATLQEAMRLMVEHALKRLPVVDSAGRYQGMISRAELLRMSVEP